MTVEQSPEDVELLKMVSHVAKAGAARYADWVDHSDVYQDLWIYAFTSNRKQLLKWQLAGEKFRLMRALFGAVKQYAETEKAAQSGYEFADVAWYSPDKLADLIPLALNREWDGMTGDEAEEGMPESQTLGREGGNLLAMVCDIRRVIDKEPARYGGWEKDTANGDANLEWLADRLGGEFPEAPGYSRGRSKALRQAAEY